MNVIDDIIQNPLLGIGISGDRRVLDDAYVHNFFIEIIANFGIILGSFIIVALIIFILKSLLTRDNRSYRLVIIWFSLGFIHLMVIIAMNLKNLIGLEMKLQIYKSLKIRI